MKYFLAHSYSAPETNRIVTEEEAARLNADDSQELYAEEVKSFTILFNAVDGEVKKTRYTPEKVLECITEMVGGLNLDGHVSNDGVIRFSGVLVTRRLFDGPKDRRIEVPLKRIIGDWMKEEAK